MASKYTCYMNDASSCLFSMKSEAYLSMRENYYNNHLKRVL